jgi:membrane protein implicated in regulation of membrane protease activity
MRPWIAYTLVRVGLFAVAFAILFLLGVPWWLAAILAAAIGFCVAYIFFRGMRERVAAELVTSRNATGKRPDEQAEDQD